VAASIAVGIAVDPVPAGAAPVPAGFSDTMTPGLASPTAMALLPDGRVLVAEQTGALRVVKAGVVLSQPFVSLSVDSTAERGLIGVAVDPSFPARPFVYVHYTVPGPPAHNRVSRFTAVGDVAAAGSEHVVVDLPSLVATNHNGGAIHFAPDGTLMIGVGENNDAARAQQLSNPFGKILRVDPTSGAAPANNPFVSTPGADPRIWVYGLRNPFTFAFQPGTGRFFIDDVGQSTFEEIDDDVGPGLNFGWPLSEGPTSNPAFVSPIFAYGHGGTGTTGCAIAGGTFYNPVTPTFGGEYAGDYFFADLCNGWIRHLDLATRQASPFVPLAGISGPVDLLTTPGGSLLYLAHNSGVLGRIDRQQAWFLRTTNTPGPPTISAVVGPVGKSVACDWNGDGIDTPGVFLDGTWYLWNDARVSAPFATFAYGTPADTPVCGDWNGDGVDTIGVYQGDHFFLRNSNTPGSPDINIHYGTAGNAVVVGDWNGDGVDTIGVYDIGHFFLRDSNTPGLPQRDVNYGAPGYVPLIGDWNGDGVDTIGVYTLNNFYLRNTVAPGVANLVIHYGSPVDRPVTGDFNGGTHTDTIGVVEPA